VGHQNAKRRFLCGSADSAPTYGHSFAAHPAWFAANMIEDRTTIFHGDYKFDNYIFSPGEAKIIAVLDWEVSICRNMSARLIHD